MHAFIVVIIYSSADCKTGRTIVHEKHNSPKRNPSYIFTVSGIIYILYIYNIYSCLWLMSWLMTNDMRVVVERGALSAVSACSVSESYFKTLSLWRDSDRVQRFFFSSNFIFWAPWDGGWSSGYDCVLSPCSSLTVIWKVPLVKYSGLPGLNTELWWSAWAGCAVKELQTPATALAASGSPRGNVFLYGHGCGRHARGMWMIDMAPRQGSNQRPPGPPVFK